MWNKTSSLLPLFGFGGTVPNRHRVCASHLPMITVCYSLIESFLKALEQSSDRANSSARLQKQTFSRLLPAQWYCSFQAFSKVTISRLAIQIRLERISQSLARPVQPSFYRSNISANQARDLAQRETFILKKNQRLLCNGGKTGDCFLHFQREFVVQQLSQRLPAHRNKLIVAKSSIADSLPSFRSCFSQRLRAADKQIGSQRRSAGNEVLRLPYQTQKAVVSYVFGHFNRSRKPVRKTENRDHDAVHITRRKAAGSPAPALSSKSSSVVLSGNRHSILQESLPTSITDKRLKDTPFLSNFWLRLRP